MAIENEADDSTPLLATIRPTRRQRQLAVALGGGLLVTFVAAAAFADKPLLATYTGLATAMPTSVIGDLITSILLFFQFSIVRSRALQVLAGGFLFSAGMSASLGLTYPGLFSPTGLLGAGLQTAGWLYLSWHIGFLAAVLGYTILKDSTHSVAAETAAWWTVALVIILVCALTSLFTAGNDIVPRLARDATTLTPLVFYLGISLTLFAIVVLAFLAIRQRSVLDQWLLIAVLAFVLEIILQNVLAAARFTVGFYVGSGFLVFNATIVMIILLAETARLYARVIRSQTALQRERQNKLLSVEAVAASISHEVRQPLAAILVNAETAALSLKHDPPDLEFAEDILRDIQSDIQRTNDVFKNIRALFVTARQELAPVDLNDIAAEALRMMRTEIDRNGIEAHISLNRTMPLVNGQRGQLLEVVLNLISNAIDAMNGVSDRDRRLTIETQSDDRGAAVLAVRDTGPGIAADDKREIFDAFVTTKPNGMGLGLALCRTIIERHGGQIAAWSGEQQKGAVIQLTLPVAAVTSINS